MPAKPLRRKPKQGRSEATRAIIVEAAAQVLLQHDYASASTNRIATRAGVSVGSIYQYFDNKSAIYAAVLDQWFQSVVSQLELTSNDAEAPLYDALVSLASRLYADWPEAPALLRKMRQVPDLELQERLDRTKHAVALFLQSTLSSAHPAQASRIPTQHYAIAVDAIEGVFLNSHYIAESEHPGTDYPAELVNLIFSYLQITKTEQGPESE